MLHNVFRNFSTAYILDFDNRKYSQHHKHNLVIFIIFNCLHIHTAPHIMSRPDSSALSRILRDPNSCTAGEHAQIMLSSCHTFLKQHVNIVNKVTFSIMIVSWRYKNTVRMTAGCRQVCGGWLGGMLCLGIKS